MVIEKGVGGREAGEERWRGEVGEVKKNKRQIGGRLKQKKAFAIELAVLGE